MGQDDQMKLRETVDAVVIGAGHHGLVTASVLADAGWDVLVLEARDKPGGAVSSVERDGWVMDEFSSCHPLAMASPVLRGLRLDELGLRWVAHTDAVLVHVGRPDDTAGALLHRDPQRTADGLAQEEPADGPAWLRLIDEYHHLQAPLLDALLTRWPPVAPGARLAAAVGARDLARLTRFLLLPTTRMGEETFRGTRGRMLLAGNAMHTDIPPDAAGSGMFGWLLTMLAQDVGYPSPEGGTRRLAELLADRARLSGARIETGEPVEHVIVSSGKVLGVTTRSGRQIAARRGVIANTSAPALYQRLLPDSAVPRRLRDELKRFEWDLPTVKLNYRLHSTLPWTASAARDAGVVHVGADVAGLVDWSADLTNGRVPQHPFALVGQMSSIDPTRSPDGTQAMWLYSHLPRGVVDDASAEQLVTRLEQMLDHFAPGWPEHVIDRWVQRPSDLKSADDNLGNGAVGGGTAQIHQQLIFRPVTGLGGARTHIEGLYLASAGTHPSGGVHGGAGYIAARCVLADQRWWGRPRRSLALAALHQLYDA